MGSLKLCKTAACEFHLDCNKLKLRRNPKNSLINLDTQSRAHKMVNNLTAVSSSVMVDSGMCLMVLSFLAMSKLRTDGTFGALECQVTKSRMKKDGFSMLLCAHFANWN